MGNTRSDLKMLGLAATQIKFVARPKIRGAMGLEEFGGDGVGEEAAFGGEGEVGLLDLGQVLVEE